MSARGLPFAVAAVTVYCSQSIVHFPGICCHGSLVVRRHVVASNDHHFSSCRGLINCIFFSIGTAKHHRQKSSRYWIPTGCKTRVCATSALIVRKPQRSSVIILASAHWQRSIRALSQPCRQTTFATARYWRAEAFTR